MTPEHYLITLLIAVLILLYLTFRYKNAGLEKEYLLLNSWYQDLIDFTHSDRIAPTQTGFGAPTFIFSHQKTNSNMVSTTDMATGYSFEYGQPTTPKGNPAPIQAGSVKNSSSDETIATVSKDPDNELKGDVQLTGKMGVYTITTEADADLSEGEAKIYGSFNGEVIASRASGFNAPVIGEPRFDGNETIVAAAPAVVSEAVSTEDEPPSGATFDKATGAAL